MITNKSLPFEIVYTTSEDENDAAVNIWGSVPGDRVLRQKIPLKKVDEFLLVLVF
jgi:hypothetical protein